MREHKKHKKPMYEQLPPVCRASTAVQHPRAMYAHCGKLAGHPGPHYDGDIQKSWT